MKKKWNTLAALTLSAALCITTAGANDLMDSAIGQGLRALITDVSGAMVMLSPIVGGAAVAYFIIRRGMADEQEGRMWTSRAKIAAICGVGGMLGSAIINLLGSYF